MHAMNCKKGPQLGRNLNGTFHLQAVSHWFKQHTRSAEYMYNRRTLSTAHTSSTPTYFILTTYFTLNHNVLMHMPLCIVSPSNQGLGGSIHATDCPQIQTIWRSCGGVHSQQVSSYPDDILGSSMT